MVCAFTILLPRLGTQGIFSTFIFKQMSQALWGLILNITLNDKEAFAQD
jgi:hypothetical protein